MATEKWSSSTGENVKAYYEKELVKKAEQPEDMWQHRSTQMKCQTCMWFLHKKPSWDGPMPSDTMCNEVGRCRKHAPTMGGWPVVFKHDWCGDHKLDENKI